MKEQQSGYTMEEEGDAFNLKQVVLDPINYIKPVEC